MTILRMASRNAQRHFIVWSIVAIILMFAGISDNQSNASRGHFERPPAVGTLEYVATKHTCKDTVKGDFPTAMIAYNMHTGGHFYTRDSAMIGAALDELFADKDWPGFSPKYFCK